MHYLITHFWLYYLIHYSGCIIDHILLVVLFVHILLVIIFDHTRLGVSSDHTLLVVLLVTGFWS